MLCLFLKVEVASELRFLLSHVCDMRLLRMAIDCEFCQKFSGRRDLLSATVSKKLIGQLGTWQAGVRSGMLENPLISPFQISPFTQMSQVQRADQGSKKISISHLFRTLILQMHCNALIIYFIFQICLK